MLAEQKQLSTGIARHPLFFNGYDAKATEILSVGWIAARDKFNVENPPGQTWAGSDEELQRARGEYQALCDAMQR